MTGPYDSIEDFPTVLKHNIMHTLGLTPGLRVRYLNDTACHDFLAKNVDTQLLRYFEIESHGSFKGDICRTAVLLKEGGFYMDLDFQLRAPLHSLIDENTTLMTVYAEQTANAPSILNALIAVKPNSSTMRATLKAMMNWYDTRTMKLLGPESTMRGILATMEESCYDVPMNHDSSEQFACGDAEHFRFYQEELIGMGDCELAGPVVCPSERAYSEYDGVKMGVFSIGKGTQEERLVGWPRVASCRHYGCDFSGGMPSMMQTGANES
jgi:hypothetical protein